jgi:hypothetical protein
LESNPLGPLTDDSAYACNAVPIGVQAMPEFRIESEGLSRESRLSALLWGAVILLIIVAVLLFAFGGRERLDANLFGITLFGAVIGTGILTCREALHYALRQMVFVLDGSAIVRKRQGYPEVKIAFSEVGSVKQEFGYLIVKSRQTGERIAIPNTVQDYEAIRTELAKQCPKYRD